MAPIYTINKIMDKNSTRIAKRRTIAFKKTPIKQNSALIGFLHKTTPLASSTANEGIPKYKTKSQKANSAEANPFNIGPKAPKLIATTVLISHSEKIILPKEAITLLFNLLSIYIIIKWRKRESNPRHSDYDSDVLPLNYSTFKTLIYTEFIFILIGNGYKHDYELYYHISLLFFLASHSDY